MADDQPNEVTNPEATRALARIMGEDQHRDNRGRYGAYCRTPGCPNRGERVPPIEAFAYPDAGVRHRCGPCGDVVAQFRADGIEPGEAQITHARGIRPFDATVALGILRSFIHERDQKRYAHSSTTKLDALIVHCIKVLDARFTRGTRLPEQWANSAHSPNGPKQL